MGSKTRTVSHKSASTHVPHKERFGNRTAPPNAFRKSSGNASKRKPVAFHNRELGSR